MTSFVDSDAVERRLAEERRSRVAAARRMQCKVCWYVYDEAIGCPETQTPAGTPFSELPEWWCCPQCGASAETFLAMDDRGEDAP